MNICKADTIELAAAADKTPPTEFRIWAYGTVKTTKYADSFLTPESAAAIVAEAEAHGIELSMDYEHAAVGPADGQPKPAAAWFKLEAREDGLWAVNVRWTPRASKMLSEGEYRHFSPTYRVNDKREIVAVINIALTNLPATRHQEPLMAAKAEAIGEMLTATSRAELVDLMSALFTASGHQTIREVHGWVIGQKMANESYRAMKTADVVSTAIAARKIKRSQRDTFMALGATIGHDELAKLVDGLDTLAGQNISEIVMTACRQGKVPPAVRGVWEEAGRALGPEWLEGAVSMLPKLVNFAGDDDLAQLDGKPGDAGSTPLDPETVSLVQRLGMTADDIRNAKKAGHL
jgi:phage I-like protein